MGNYWSAAAPRIAWDRDGSILNYWPSTNVLTRLPQSAMSWLNSESGDNTASTQQQQWNTGATINNFMGIAVIFPFPRDMYSLFSFGTSHPLNTIAQWELSPNTTNGLDGTWTAFGPVADSPYIKPYYRVLANMLQLPQNASTMGIRGVRLRWPDSGGNNNLNYNTTRAIHLYGWPSASATPDRLDFWDPVNNVRLAANAFDFGDFPRSTSASVQFRLKNQSASRTANNTVLSVEVLSDTSPTVLSQYLIGDPNGVYAPTQTISSIAAGAISQVYTLQRVTPATAQLSTWSARLDTSVGSWV